MDVALDRLRRIGGKRLAIKIIDAFLDDAPRKVGAMRDGGRDGELGAVEAAAHSLRSSAGNLGLDGLMDLAARIERLAAARERDPLPGLIEDLEVGVERARSALETRKRELET